MKFLEINEALLALWVLVREPAPVVIGSQSLHGKFPDLADSILYSREVDVILPNKAKLGNWLVDVVGDGTPFAVERGYFIDHVVAIEGLPILADGWFERAIRNPIVLNGETEGFVSFLSPEDMAVSKLGVGRQKDLDFIHVLAAQGFIKLDPVRGKPCRSRAGSRALTARLFLCLF